MDIKDKVAVITGGASGLGRATADAIVAAGGKVALLDRNAELVEQAASELAPDAVAHAVDVTDADSVAAAIDAVVERFGAIHIDVNCAGIGTAGRTVGRDGPLDLRAFNFVIQVNLVGTFNSLRLCAAHMANNEPAPEDGERGVIINTASVAAFDGQIGQAAYSASKGGVVGMTLPIARDLSRDGIRCCTIAPGIFETPMLMGLPEPARQSLAASIPFPQRLGTPAEYAALACHIMENVMLNGETIRLDGAIRMAPK